jgi:hypothetical protein
MVSAARQRQQQQQATLPQQHPKHQQQQLLQLQPKPLLQRCQHRHQQHQAQWQ